jgi:predicted ABC-type exoprotein transport system permease subunit
MKTTLRKSKVFSKVKNMSQQLKDRTNAFAVRVIKMCREIPGGKIEDILIRQIVRSATSIGAN